MFRAPGNNAPNNTASEQSQSNTKPNRYKSFFKRWFHQRHQHNLRQSIVNLVDDRNNHLPTIPDDNKEEFNPHERLLISNILRLKDKTADDVMIPRADIFAIDDSINFKQALEIMQHENHSRVPVYHQELDNIQGMLHVKDLISYIGHSEDFDFGKVIRQPLFIAPQIPVLDLLLQMRVHRIHLGLVIDEHGSIDGLITIEDLVETIVGDIADEHDEPEANMIIERGNNTLDVDARAHLEDLEEKIGSFLTEEEKNSDMDTLGGLVFHLAEHIPTKGEVLTHPSGLIFRVLEADPRHIRRLRMHIPQNWSLPTSNDSDTLSETNSNNI